MEDPVFEPWSLEDWPPPSYAPAGPATSDDIESEPRVRGVGTVDFLRSVASARLGAISRRLRMARHETSVEDLLDGPARLLRFDLRPWPGPLSGPAAQRSAMLEFGLGTESDDLVTAWYWLDGLGEAPDEIANVPSSKLTVSWIEHVILDFVGKVLARS